MFSCNSAKKTTTTKNELRDSYQILTLHTKLYLVKKPTLKLDFTSNKISGNAGCNSFGGKIIITGNLIKFEGIYATEMFCENMDVEKEFFKKLGKTDHFKVKNDQLFLYDKEAILLITCQSTNE